MPTGNKFDLEAASIIRQVYTKNSKSWEETQKRNSLALFYLAAKKVPAYKDFLRVHGIDPKKVKTFRDFQQVPFTTKENYLKKYPLSLLTANSGEKTTQIFTSSSGSTGESFYFPRTDQLDWQSSIYHEIFLNNLNFSRRQPTLIIIAFGMGVWIGGLITFRAFQILNSRVHLPLSVITPGINKNEVLHALKYLAPKYKQTILTGYPPFIKDILDQANSQRISLNKLNLKLLFAAETFTENFRDHVAELGKIKNPIFATANVYGTADLGTTAIETPLSITIRKLAAKSEKIHSALFPETQKLPTLAQYIPQFINFEEFAEELILTGDNAVPLVRYAIGDKGGVISYDKIRDILPKSTASKKIFDSPGNSQLPFVYVYERTNFAAKLHLRDIYPQVIKDALLYNPICKQLTGKFTMSTKYNNLHDQYLEINLEKKKGAKINNKLNKIIYGRVLTAILTKTEGPGDPKELKNKKLIKLIFWPYEHPLYFKSGIKQKWTINQKV
jgi:phenylacetate-CoA ligase